MIKFIPEDSFYISGKGLVYTGKCPVDVPRSELGNAFLGVPVEINGTVFTVLGVESHAVEFEHSLDRPIGLVVDFMDFRPIVVDGSVWMEIRKFDESFRKFPSVEVLDAFIKRLTE